MLHLQSVSTIKQCVPNYHLLVVITIRGYFNGRQGSFFQKTCKKLYLATYVTKCYFVVFLYFLPKIQVLEFLYDHVIGGNNGFQHQMLISQSVFLYFDFPQNGSSKNVPFYMNMSYTGQNFPDYRCPENQLNLVNLVNLQPFVKFCGSKASTIDFIAPNSRFQG